MEALKSKISLSTDLIASWVHSKLVRGVGTKLNSGDGGLQGTGLKEFGLIFLLVASKFIGENAS